MGKQSLREAFRRIWTVVAMLALITIGLAGPADATTTVYKNSYSGTSATASFSFSDPDGCVYEGVYVQASSGKNKDSLTGKSSPSVAVLYIERYDYCSGLYFYGYGAVDLNSGAFIVRPTLDLATLQATVPVYDYWSGSTVSVLVDVSWSATGGAVTDKYYYKTTFENGSKITQEFSGTRRPATAFGSFVSESFDFTLSQTNDAAINQVKSGQLTIAKS